MFKHILYATDGSEHAQKALDVVCELAPLHQSDVTVLHAYPSPIFYYPDVLTAPYYSELIENAQRAAENIVNEAVHRLKMSGVTVVTQEIVKGSAPNAILKAAKARGCDLIVLGARGLSDLQGLLLGSISHRVIQHATCPVLVVR